MRRRLEALRGAFWLPSAAGVPVFIVLAFLTTQIDRGTKIELGLFGLSDAASARAVLQTIATATVSVAGLAFSVTLVALTLAAQQLSPRVLRTFRADRVTTDAPGYLTDVDGGIIERAAGLDVLVVQRVSVGDFLVSGQEIGEVWAGGDEPPELGGLRSDFRLAPERTLAADVAFPVRQLSDIALKALSPGINDPTTAENAMGSLADTLVRLAGEDPVAAVRVDEEGEPRLCAEAVYLDALVRLGFEQVRHASAGKPVMAQRLEALLVEVIRSAKKAGCSSDEAERQRALLAGRR